VLQALLNEIEEDRGVLQRVITALGGSANPVKRASAVGMERLGSLRMALPVLGPGSGEAARLEELEVLSLGIQGKWMLWKLLGTLATSDWRLVGFDFAGLERRAESQRRRLTRATSSSLRHCVCSSIRCRPARGLDALGPAGPAQRFSS
jgi:hypothetical protein